MLAGVLHGLLSTGFVASRLRTTSCITRRWATCRRSGCGSSGLSIRRPRGRWFSSRSSCRGSTRSCGRARRWRMRIWRRCRAGRMGSRDFGVARDSW